MLHKFDRDDELLQPLHELFSSSSENEDGKENTIMRLTEAYHMYKRKYLEHLSFNPKGEKLGKFIVTNALIIDFSCHAGACPIEGSVHLL